MTSSSRPRDFGRYDDVDGDGIPYRTLPGAHPTRGAYFTRGTSRDRYARYTEEGAPYVDNMERLLRKFETARGLLPPPARAQGRAADAHRRDPLRLDRRRDGRGRGSAGGTGFDVDALRSARLSARPEIADFVDAHEQVFVVEQNRDAQMRTLLIERPRRRPGPPDLDPPLRRDADHRPLHRPAKSPRRLPKPVARKTVEAVS